MKFITSRTSETGKKFEALIQKKNIATKAARKLAGKLGIKEWRSYSFAIWGGMSAVTFYNGENIDTKIWLKIKGRKDEYRPRGNTKAGKEMQQLFDHLPIVYNSNLNACIGWEEPFHHIGFDLSNADYFGFEILEKWGIKIPIDCEEVTTTRYKEIFK